MKGPHLAEVIRGLLASPEWAHLTPQRINGGGYSGPFQELVLEAGVEGAVARSTEDTPEAKNAVGGHSWIFHEGRHYDAESPDGVVRWRDLPIFVRSRARVPPAPEPIEPIRIRVTRETCGHSARICSWEWLEAPPHVKRFITGELDAVLLELAEKGYAFSVEVVAVEISLMDWLGAARVFGKSTTLGE